jgi:tRNA (uracil-5-)-methyltransferase
MDCNYFGICGSCTLGGKTYEEQLNLKIENEKKRFLPLWDKEFDIIQSKDGGFRNRAEFRIWRIFNEDGSVTFSFAMNDKEKKPFAINSCSIVATPIAILMPKLLEHIQNSQILNHKLFSCEFLSSTIGDILVTLIYHTKLDETWSNEAKKIEQKLNIKIIGRSRKQKVIISEDFIDEQLTVLHATFKIQYKEGGFTQPNQKVNEKMIEWAIQNSSHNSDLCELYCGGGNFTIPFSNYFEKVLATEISKTSIRSAKQNCELNDIKNIKFIRMSSEEFVEAKEEKREFKRLNEADVNLKDYHFSTIFVDPPRAGLDETTRNLSSNFDQIIYISCNPETLLRDLEILCHTHSIKRFALFDQFAFSKHIECGVVLSKINNNA